MTTMQQKLRGLNNLASDIHTAAKSKGFHNQPQETGTTLMLMVSELSEALEADRKGRYTKYELFHETLGFLESIRDPKPDPFTEAFEDFVKDTHEDEIADAFIRLLDYVGKKQINLEWHVAQKMRYNQTREHKHGKAY